MGTVPFQPQAINDRQDANGWLYGSYSARSLASDAERTINMYLELVQSGSGKSRATLYGTPGLTLFSALPGGLPCLGVYSFTVAEVDYVLAVSGTSLYQVFQDGTSSLVGPLNIDLSDNHIHWSDNGRGSVAIATGNALYIYNATPPSGQAVLQQIFLNITNQDGSTTTTSTPLQPTCVTFIDGYFFALTPETNTVNSSDIDNPYSWNALSFIVKDGAPGQTVSIAADHLQLWVFSTLNAEIYYDAGNPPPGFPFNRIQGGFVQYGLASHAGVVNMQDGLFWVGRTAGGQLVAYRNNGYTANRISDHAVESAWNDYTPAGMIYSSYYLQEGHEFFRLDFPDADGGNGHTWVFDTATRVWHERLYWNSTLGQYQANPARYICFAWGLWIAADYSNGNIYSQSLNELTDNGNLIRRQRKGSPLARTMDWVTFHEFQLDMQMGIGVPVTGQGDNPLVILRFSDDGGYTWSNEIPCSIGREGNTQARAMWRRLGNSRDRVFEVTITDPIQVAIINAYIRVSPGNGA